MGDNEILFSVADINYLSVSTLLFMNMFIIDCRDSFHEICELITRNRKNKKRKREWQYDLFARFAGIDIRKCTELELECLCIPYVVLVKRLKKFTSRWNEVPYDDLITLAMLLDVDSDGYISWKDYISFFKRLESYLTDSKNNCSPVAAFDKMYFYRLKSIQEKSYRIQQVYCSTERNNDSSNYNSNLSSYNAEKIKMMSSNARSRHYGVYMPLKICLAEFISEHGTVYKEVQWKDSLLEAAMARNPNTSITSGDGVKLPPLPAMSPSGIIEIIRKISLYIDTPVLIEQGNVTVTVNDSKANPHSECLLSPKGTWDAGMFLSPPNTDTNTMHSQPNKISRMKLTPSNTMTKALSIEAVHELNESDIQSTGSGEDTLYVSTHASSIYSGISNLSDISSHYESPIKSSKNPNEEVLNPDGDRIILSGLDELTMNLKQEINILNTSGLSSNNSRTNSRTNSRSSTPTSTFRPAGSPIRTHGGKPTYGLDKVPKQSMRHMEHGLKLSNPPSVDERELNDLQSGYLPKMNSSVVGVHTVGNFGESSYDYLGTPCSPDVPLVVYTEYATPSGEHRQGFGVGADHPNDNDISQLSNGSAGGPGAVTGTGAGGGTFPSTGCSSLPKRTITPNRVNGRSTTPPSVRTNRSHNSITTTPTSINSRRSVTPLGGFKGPTPNGTTCGMRVPTSGPKRPTSTPTPPLEEEEEHEEEHAVDTHANADAVINVARTTEANLEMVSIDVLKQNILKLQGRIDSMGVPVDRVSLASLPDIDNIDNIGSGSGGQRNDSITTQEPVSVPVPVPVSVPVRVVDDVGINMIEDDCDVDIESSVVDDGDRLCGVDNDTVLVEEEGEGDDSTNHISRVTPTNQVKAHYRNTPVTPTNSNTNNNSNIQSGGLTPHHGAYNNTHDRHNTAELLAERKKTVSRQKEVVKEWKEQLIVTGTSISITPVVVNKSTPKTDMSTATQRINYSKLSVNLPESHPHVKMSIFKSPTLHKPPPKRNIYQNHTCSWVSRNVTGKYNNRFATTNDVANAKKFNAVLGDM